MQKNFQGQNIDVVSKKPDVPSTVPLESHNSDKVVSYEPSVPQPATAANQEEATDSSGASPNDIEAAFVVNDVVVASPIL